MDDGRCIPWLIGGVVASGVALVAAALSPDLWPIVALNLVLGVGIAVAMAADQTLLQQRVPDAVRGRVSAAFGVALIASFALGAGVGGLVVDSVGARWAYGVAGAALLPSALLFVRVGRVLAHERALAGRNAA